MTTATLVVLRHGQTEDNLKHINSAQNDVPLTAIGEKQARAAGRLLKGFHFDKVYSSPLGRAFNTAAQLLKSLGTQKHLLNKDKSWQIETRQEILEQNDGVLTGRHMDDPAVVEYFKHSVFDSAPPGGESDKQFVARVQKFYEEEILPRLARGENVLITAHTGTIRALDIAMGLNDRPQDGQPWKNRRRIPNAGPDVHEYVDGVLKKSYAIENPVTAKVARQHERAKKQAEKLAKKANTPSPKA